MRCSSPQQLLSLLAIFEKRFSALVDFKGNFIQFFSQFQLRILRKTSKDFVGIYFVLLFPEITDLRATFQENEVLLSSFAKELPPLVFDDDLGFRGV